jgi:hypothetical protein
MIGEIKQYTQEDCVAINQFSEKYFPKKPDAIIKRSSTPNYFRWKYGPNPFGNSIMFTYWEGRELLGCFGAVPEPLAIRSKKVLAYQLTDAFVAPAMHGKGIFGHLAGEVFKEIDKVSDICFGMSPSEYSLPIFTKKYAMYIAPKYRQVYSPLRFNDILRAKNLRLISPLGNILNVIRNNLFSKPAIDIEEINHIPSSYYNIYNDEYDFSIHKDQEYVTYRYEQCPESYRFFKVSDKDYNNVVLVIKLVLWQNITMCYLVDIIGSLGNGNATIFLCHAIYTIAFKTSSSVVSMELHNPKSELSKLLFKGFLCHNREECVFMRQHSWPFLNPASADYDSKRWIIFSGDSDYI